MPIPPALPFGGYTGYRFLEKTYDRQFALFNKSPDVQRDIDYFEKHAGSIKTVDQLMDDRRVLRVVLGAYGLDEDINKGAFIRKVFEEGTIKSDAFANKLAAPAYAEMSRDLGFGDIASTLVFSDTRKDIVARYRERQFEIAVGDIDIDMRSALNFRREADIIGNSTKTDKNGWLRLLGSKPLREVLETALNLPAQFAQIDLDRQIEEIGDRAERLLGIKSPKEFADPQLVDKVIQRFMLNRQIENGAVAQSTPGAAALSILQSGGQANGLGAGAQINLILSNAR